MRVCVIIDYLLSYCYYFLNNEFDPPVIQFETETE